MQDGHYDKTDGKKYKFKAVWWEDKDENPLTAYGDSWYVTGSAIVFVGKMGDIVFTPSVKVIIK